MSYDVTPSLSVVLHGPEASSNAHGKVDELVKVWTPFDAFIGD